MKAEFPLVPVLARSLDREHAIELINAGVEYQIRETFESALALGEKALEMLDVDEEERERVMEDVRRRDSDRLTIELTEGIYAGRDLIHGNAPIKDKKGGTDSAR